MTTIMASIIAEFWPAILGVAGLVGGVVFGWVKKKSADTKVAQSQAIEAQAKQQTAEQKSAADRANAAAAQAGEDAVANRAKADQAVAALAPGQLDDELARLGALRKEQRP